MDKQVFNPEKIKSKLQFYNYSFKLNDSTLKIFLPMFCYLKIKFSNNGVKMTSHLRFGFDFLPLELNFLIYSAILYVLAWFQWTSLNKGIFVLFGLLVIHFVICFIIIESMRVIIHKWIDQDSKE
jgi:hypothetical protein